MFLSSFHAFARSQLLKTRFFFLQLPALEEHISAKPYWISMANTPPNKSALQNVYRLTKSFIWVLGRTFALSRVQTMNQFPRSLLLVNLADARSSTQEGHCCRKTFPWQAASCVCQTDNSEKREGACTSFVVGKSNVYQPPVGPESPNWCLFC